MRINKRKELRLNALLDGFSSETSNFERTPWFVWPKQIVVYERFDYYVGADE